FLHEFLHGAHCFADGMVAGPMEHVEVEPVGSEALQAALARSQRAFKRGVRRHYFARQKNFVTPPGNRFGHQLLHATVAVQLSGIDVRHSQIKAQAQRFRGALLTLPAALHHPRALTYHRDLDPSPTKLPLGHTELSTSMADNNERRSKGPS